MDTERLDRAIEMMGMGATHKDPALLAKARRNLEALMEAHGQCGELCMAFEELEHLEAQDWNR